MIRTAAAILLAAALWSVGVPARQATAGQAQARPAAEYDSGDVPVRLSPSQLLTFGVRLNGTPIQAIVDTGSSAVLVDAAFASAHSLRSDRLVAADAVGGPARVGALPALRLTIGGAELEDVAARAADLTQLNGASGADAAVIVGMSGLGGGTLNLDFRRMKLSISSRAATAVRGSRPYPLSLVKGLPVVTVPLNGRPARIAIDTGQDSDLDVSAAEFAALRPAGVHATTIASAGVGGMSIASLYFRPSLDVGGTTASQVAVKSDPVGGLSERLGVDAVAGLRLLRRLDLTLDFKNGQAYLDRSGAALPPLIKSTSGLQLAYGSFATVMHVMVNSPAADQGWKVGDRICSIDGHSIPEVRGSPLLKVWGSGSPGNKVSIAMCDGSSRQLTLRTFY